MEEIKDKDYSLEAVPESARKGFRSMFFVMLGFTFFSASMSVGAKLGNGLDFKEFVLACVIFIKLSSRVYTNWMVWRWCSDVFNSNSTTFRHQ